MQKIAKITDKTIETYEIEYIKDEPYFIGVRLYGENKQTGEKIATEINKELGDHIISTQVYTPHPDTVRFGFSGFEFTGIEIEVDLNTVTDLNEDFIVMEADPYKRDI